MMHLCHAGCQQVLWQLTMIGQAAMLGCCAPPSNDTSAALNGLLLATLCSVQLRG